jgi:hypothetical protein
MINNKYQDNRTPGSINHNMKVMTQDLSRGCVPLHHVVRWLIGHTLSLSKGAIRTYQIARACNDTSNLLTLPLTLRRGRHKPLTITNSCQRLQAAPSRLDSGNHQEKQESHSKSTTKCQLDAISQCKYTWITQSHFEYAKKQER